jgi:GNAT superfamily N-acetyltransferase
MAPPEVTVRSTSPSDDRSLATLLEECYPGTVDFDPEHDFQKELGTWRNADHGDDTASVVGVVDGELVAACLVGYELGSPLIYEVAVAPQRRRTGTGNALLATSLTKLAERRPSLVAAWVTLGNFASEALFRSTRFVTVGPPVDVAAGVAHYRAGLAAEQVDVSDAVSLATDLAEDGHALLWVVAQEPGAPVEVMIRGTPVTVVRIGRDDPRVPHVAHHAVPIAGAAWLFARRD